MITLNFCKKPKEIQEKMVAEYVRLNLKHRDKKSIRMIDSWCYARLNAIQPDITDLKSLMALSPEKLKQLRVNLESMSRNFPSFQKDMEIIGEYILKALYLHMHKEAKAYLLQTLDVRVCPYCNRNYVNSEGNINTCELDHFFPKSAFPILGACFYNLIPVCSVCNRKKSDQELHYYPHIQKKKEPVHFSYQMDGADYLNADQISIKITVDDPIYQEDVDILKLEPIYQTHRKEVQELLEKGTVFSDSYIAALSAEFPDLFQSDEDVKALIYGVPLEKDQYGNVPLAKLKGDILEELH